MLFRSAVEHVARISRVLQQPFGNVMLVGMGGSGRQSLTRLATAIVDYKLYQLEMTSTYGVRGSAPGPHRAAA